MIDRNGGTGPRRPSIARQCALLGLSRSGLYYRPRGVPADDLALMRLLDEQYLKTPVYGSRKMTAQLRREGHRVNRKRVRRLMRRMGLEAIYRRPRTTVPSPEHKVYPYLLRDVAVTRPNQVWAADITYVPMAKGFMYLVAVIDWYSRKVLAHRVSNTMEAGFCVEALKEALARHGRPEIFNTDQGSQFTSAAFTGVLEGAGVRISMDGKGRCHDNIFIERLWRTVKYEYLYLHVFEGGQDLKTGLKSWVAWYNRQRPHQGLGYQTPDEVYDKEQEPTTLVA
jgi:putative transposase